MEKIVNWIKQVWFTKLKSNKCEFAILVVILAVGAFLRLYKIGDYMTFLGDEGRDVIVVRRLLVNFDPILIGPGTSIGNMYLGPLYYYLIAPALLLAGFSPVGPAVMVAVLAVATIWLVWRIGRELFGPAAAGLAAALYAISPTVITYSRSSWNPNIMPFFALLCIYSIWKVWSKKDFKWLIVLGISYAFVLQSHYLGLLLAPVLFLFLFLTYLQIRKLKIRNFIGNLFIGLLVFIFLMSPLVIFDARHGWRNFAAMKTFFSERQTTISARPWSAIPKLYPILEKVNTSLIAGKNETVGRWMTVGIVVLLGWLILFKRSKLLTTGYFLLFSWLGFSLLGLGLYKQEIYDHYYGFFFPAPFLLLGAIAQTLVTRHEGLVKKTIDYCLMPIALAILMFVNIQNLPLRFPPNMQLQRSRSVAEKIAIESGEERFNLAVVAERNYEDGYQYFLEKEDRPVVDIDAQVPETITDQLFVVCEMPKEKCDPTHSAKAEVANFGWSKIESQWEVFGVTIYKLVHTD